MDKIHFAPENETMVETITIVGNYSPSTVCQAKDPGFGSQNQLPASGPSAAPPTKGSQHPNKLGPRKSHVGVDQKVICMG